MRQTASLVVFAALCASGKNYRKSIFSIKFNRYIKFTEILVWLDSHNLKDYTLYIEWDRIFKNFGIPGLSLLLEYGYLKNNLTCLERSNIPKEIENWFVLHNITLTKYSESNFNVYCKN